MILLLLTLKPLFQLSICKAINLSFRLGLLSFLLLSAIIKRAVFTHIATDGIRGTLS